jgi:hypothetical protein
MKGVSDVAFDTLLDKMRRNHTSLSSSSRMFHH